MARTKQTARKTTGGRAPLKQYAPVKGQNNIVEDPELDDEAAKKLKEIEEGDMKAELKHIDKKYTEQGHAYFVSRLR
jgi:hypothetical protein